VPVDYQSFASIEEETAYLIADNKIAELAEMDEGALKELLTELTASDIDMDLTGFTNGLLGNIMNTDGNPNDPEKEWEGESKFEDEPKCFKTIRVHFMTENQYNDFLSKTSGERNNTMCWWIPINE
jgi:hypothetical protein